MKEKNRTIIAVGDIHGDMEGLLAILRHASLINTNNDWAGKDTVLIQTGDIIDRGPDSWGVFLLLQKLQAQARRSSGRVIRLLGNHELMLVQGQHSFADYPDPEKLVGIIKEDIHNGSVQASAYFCNRIFIHAAIRSTIIEYLKSGISNRPETFEEALVAGMNSVLKDAVAAGDFSHQLFESDGIFWSRYREDLMDKSSHQIRQVFGHTPGDNIRASDTGSRICIDIGLVFTGNRAYLRFMDGKITAVECSSGLWEEITLGEY